ncbi:hypothetical protein I350_08008 [Cryptococcus amylolentus CBS 6273]|uniref:Uncharacterized protein n=1 Tax=Cryptococcus amylolentus CBS 6273 TaxID=1296118 RepID=A0A1E3J828_9TREE|nr:hypothetical protein I350_08008 [Cryptococcus amylolentus CBS 6273]
MPSEKAKILFLTAQHGQANVHLAVIAALQSGLPLPLAPDLSNIELDLHLASFPHLAKRVPAGVTWWEIEGKGFAQRFEEEFGKAEGDRRAFDLLSYSTGFLSSLYAYTQILPVVHPETPSQYLTSCLSLENILTTLSPDLVVVDQLFAVARDVLGKGDWKWIRLSPNSIKEVATIEQGLGIFRWPALCTGFPYPVPYSLLPLNIFSTLFPLFHNPLNPLLRAFNTARHSAGYKGQFPLLHPGEPTGRHSRVICMSTPGAEIDAVYPGKDKVVCAGPILLPVRPLADADPELLKWLGPSQLVLINLGTHFLQTPSFANAILHSILSLLTLRPDLKVLWKLCKYGEYDIDLSLLGDDVLGKRVRVVEWLDAEPGSILHSGKVACFVNHGGSNSYHDGLAAGVPQIVLSAWFDCHDFSTRVEHLGNGVWGNKHAA